MIEPGRIEHRFPILFAEEKGFDAPILVKTLTETTRALDQRMEVVSEPSAYGTVTTERVLTLRSGEFRIAVYPGSIRIRRRIGDRWNSVSIETSRADGPDEPASADDIARADDIIREVAGAAWRHRMMGMSPDVDPIRSLFDEIENDAPTMAAVVAATGRPTPVVVHFALPSQLTPGSAIANASETNMGARGVMPDSTSLPESLSEEWGARIPPFLYVTRANVGIPTAARAWMIERFSFGIPVDIDAVSTLRLIASMPERLSRHLGPMLKG
jgi:hypothetical protein